MSHKPPPSADSFEFHICGHCPCAHVVLIKNGKPAYQFTVAPDQVDDLVKGLRAAHAKAQGFVDGKRRTIQ